MEAEFGYLLEVVRLGYIIIVFLTLIPCSVIPVLTSVIFYCKCKKALFLAPLINILVCSLLMYLQIAEYSPGEPFIEQVRSFFNNEASMIFYFFYIPAVAMGFIIPILFKVLDIRHKMLFDK